MPAPSVDIVGKDEQRLYICAANVFLACKAEEQFRKLRDVVNVCHVIGN